MPDPVSATDSNAFDLIVIGAGPGGYVAAIRAAQLGLKVACVEKTYLGGTCLNVGCIPSKALLESSHHFHDAKHAFAKHGITVGDIKLDLTTMMKRKDEVVKGLTGGVGFLFKKNKVTHLPGTGKITGPNTVGVNGTKYQTKNILIATGSAPIQIPGLTFDNRMILDSTGALAMSEVPKKLLIVGGGYIGVELGSVWNRLGSEVHIVEFLDRILPVSDVEMAGQLHKMLEKQGLKFQFKTGATSAKVEGNQVRVGLKSGETTSEVVVDKVIVCVGRKPYTQDLGLESIGVTLSPKGFIPVNDHYQTTVPSIRAIGDVIGKIMLAHNAEEEGVAAVELILGKAGHVNYKACPSVVYTHPELGSVGLTEAQAKEQYGDIKVGKFPMIANGRARSMGENEGFIKVIGDAKTDRLLGVHVLSAHASDVIAEATVAMEFAASVEDLARCFHAHPTLSEALKEAAMAVVNGQPIHA
jgi:dihydrolipoamide dehydrogenase